VVACRFLLRAGLTLTLALPLVARAVDYRAGPEDYRGYLSRLKPGDRVILSPGDYLRGLPLQGLAGAAGQPIVIEGPAEGRRARFIARQGANTVSLVDVEHVSVRHLELDGRNLPVDAVKAEGHARYAHHVRLENLHIHGHGNNQQTVGISTKCPARGWVIRDSVIVGAGTGIYLGNSDGSAPFWGGIIERNQVLDSQGYDLQIKHQKSRLPGFGSDEAPSVTILRHNFFRKADNSSRDKLARPNVLLGHLPLEGAGSDDRYLVYGNVFFHNPTEALFQAEGRLALYNNVFINPTGDAIHIQPHNDIPRDMDIFFNTVVASGAGIVVRQKAENGESFSQRVAGNLVSASLPIQGGEARHNLTLPYQADLARIDHIPALSDRLMPRGRPGGKLPAGIHGHLARYPDWDRDSDGAPRQTTRPGAVFSARARTWIQSANDLAHVGH
jgi:hypothetical protein